MVNKGDITDSAIILTGIGVSLADIQSILSIILLVFNCLWLIMKFVLKVLKYYKNDGKIDDAEAKDIKKDFEEIDNLIDRK